MPKAN